MYYQARRNIASTNCRLSRATLFFTILFLLASSTFSQTHGTRGNQKRLTSEPGPARSLEHPKPALESNESPPAPVSINGLDVAALVRECNISGALMRRRMFQYTYTLKKIRRSLNDSGKSVDEVVDKFEAYPVRGEHVLIQLTKNDVPLPEWQITSDRKRAGEQLLKAENEANSGDDKSEQAYKEDEGYVSAGIYGKANGKHVWIIIDISDILRSCDFSSPRLERAGSREAIALDFHPREGLSVPSNRQYIPKLVGTVWIDTADKTVARLEARLAPQFIKDPDNQGPALIYEQERQPTGAWFPTLIRVNANGNTSLLNGLNWDVTFEFSDYRQFTSNADDVKIKEPKGSKSQD